MCSGRWALLWVLLAARGGAGESVGIRGVRRGCSVFPADAASFHPLFTPVPPAWLADLSPA